jgi:photosystem II stability/assembly factor-like uncharacterized protein
MRSPLSASRHFRRLWIKAILLVTLTSGLLVSTAAVAVANWTPQVSGTSAQLHHTDFIDASTGWAVGDGGTVLKTINGGETWTAQTSGTGAFLSTSGAGPPRP